MKKQLKLSQSEYDETLDRLIPFLNQYPCKFGKEGCAYFIGDEYVVKVIENSPRQEQLEALFDCYVKEQQKFVEAGCLSPTIYSYKKVRSINKDGLLNTNFYILEDKFKGNDIFTKSPTNFIENFKRAYSTNPQSQVSAEDKEIMLKGMETFISGFIVQNAFLMGLSDDKFDKLISSVYTMFKDGKYSVPDIHEGNLLVNEKGFNVIDNFMLDRQSTAKYLNSMKSETFLTSRMLNVFNENKKINDIFRDSDIIANNHLDKLYSLQQENMVYTEAVMKKMMSSIKKCIAQNEQLDLNLFISILRKRLEHYIGRERADVLSREIERE